jgi:hypothetical protein
MGIEHLVLFKLKEGTTEEQIAELVAGLQTLASLPGVEKITAGTSPSALSSSTDHHPGAIHHDHFATKWGVVQFHLHDTHHTPRHATGKNFSERSKGFNFALRVTFTGRAALDAYLPHPDHVKVKDQFIVPITEDILAVDYEF